MKSFSPSFFFAHYVRRKGAFLATACVILVLFASVFHASSFGATGGVKPAPGIPSDLSQKDIKNLIQRLEDPAQRAALIGQLKLLLKAQEASSSKEKPAAFPINHMYAGFVQQLDKTLAANLRSFQKFPGKIRELAGKWEAASAKENLAWDLARLVLALAVALLLLVGLRRAANRFLPGAPEEGNGVPWPKRLGMALRRWIELALPPGVLLLAGSLFVILFGLGRCAIVGGARALLSPEQPPLRLFPVSDEVAGYITLWSRRLVRVGVWGEALARAADVLGLGPDAVGTLSGLYRLILLLQALVLVLQNREVVRAVLSAEEPEGAGKGVRAAIAFWNIITARWYFIAVPYFIVFFFLWSSDSGTGLKFLITSTALTVGIVGAAYILNRAVLLGTERFFAVSDRLKLLVPGIEDRANRYTPVISRALSGIIWVAAVVLALDAWGIPTLDVLFSASGMIFIRAIIGVLFTAAVATLVIEGFQAGSEYFLSGRRDTNGEPIEPTAQQRTLLPLGCSVIKWITIGIAAMIILDNLGVNIAPVLAGAGILGLAIGFGAQSLVKDIITGVFMLIEDNIAVGNIVKVKDIGGQVEGFTLRSVRLRDYDGNVHVIPNSAIDVVTNFTKEFSRAVFDIGVAYRENVDEVIGIIREVSEEMQADPEWGNDILEPVDIAGLDRFGDSSLIIRGRFKTRPIKQWGVRREFHRRIKKAFDERGIEIPFPYRTLTWAEPKEPDKEKARQDASFLTPPPPIPPGEDPKTTMGETD